MVTFGGNVQGSSAGHSTQISEGYLFMQINAGTKARKHNHNHAKHILARLIDIWMTTEVQTMSRWAGEDDETFRSHGQ